MEIPRILFQRTFYLKYNNLNRINYDTVPNFTNHIKDVKDKSKLETFSGKSISLLGEQAL